MNKRSGVVLFVVVIVVAMLALAAYSFSILMRGELLAARARGDLMKSQALVDSGISYLNGWAGAFRSERDSAGGIDFNEMMFRNLLVDSDPATLEPGFFSVVRPSFHEINMNADRQEPSVALQNQPFSAVEFGVLNESSKLHLATVLHWDEEFPGAGRVALMSIPGMSEAIADSILDWIDPDDDVREFGAEAQYYSSLNPPRMPANKIPNSLDELLMIRGIQPEQLYGFDANRNYVVEAFERPGFLRLDDQQQTQQNDRADEPLSRFEQQQRQQIESEPLPKPWIYFLTVHSAERNEDYFGKRRINLNDPDLSRLHRKLSSAFGSDVANFVMALRKLGPYEGSSPPSSESVPSTAKLGNSANFEIPSVGRLLTMRVAIGEDSERRIFASPWHVGGDANRRVEFATFADRVTISEKPVLRGRINVNSAPPEVLAAIPGMTADIAQRIANARRENQSDRLGDSPSRFHPFWLVEDDVIDLNTFVKISPYLTAGGDVFRAQVVGYYANETPFCRAEVIVDGTDQSSRPLYYENLNRLGRGFRLDQFIPPSDSVLPPSP